MELIDLLNKAIGLASNKMRIEAPKVVIGDFPLEYVFDSSMYEIRLNNDFVNNNDELMVVGMAIHETRHAYQFIQVKFSDELKKNRIPTESNDTLELWKHEFEIHNTKEDWNLDIEIDAFAFMIHFMRILFGVDTNLDEEKMILMSKKLKYFNIIYK